MAVLIIVTTLAAAIAQEEFNMAALAPDNGGGGFEIGPEAPGPEPESGGGYSLPVSVGVVGFSVVSSILAIIKNYMHISMEFNSNDSTDEIWEAGWSSLTMITICVFLLFIMHE